MKYSHRVLAGAAIALAAVSGAALPALAFPAPWNRRAVASFLDCSPRRSRGNLKALGESTMT